MVTLPTAQAQIDTRYWQTNSRTEKRLHDQLEYISRKGTLVLFNEATQGLSPAGFYTLLRGHQGERVGFHRLVFSLSSGLQGLGEQGARDWTRSCVGLLGTDLRLRMMWCGAVHTDTDNLHSHVVLMGCGRTPEGVCRDVHLGRRQLDLLRAESARLAAQQASLHALALRALDVYTGSM